MAPRILLVLLISSLGCTSQQLEVGEPAEITTTPSATAQHIEKTIAVIKTNMGTIEVELFKDKAPVTVENFVKYAESGYYNGLIFHRVIDGFMIRGGGFEPGMKPRPHTFPSIKKRGR